jgi:anti-repressor protein
MELIKITEQNGNKAVSARELHQFLDNKDRFSKWFERMKSYGFEESIDFQGCELYHAQANQTITDYALSVDCAKEISMLQKSEKGKLARLYFIEMEKQVLRELPEPPKRKHNRLTVDRVNDIMHYVCMIDDRSLRMIIAEKLKP